MSSDSADAKKTISKLLKAQDHIWNQVFNFMNFRSLKCAVELGIPDIIHSHGKPITISELNAALSIHPTKAQCLARLMRVLVHSGIFACAKTKQNDDDEEGEEGYVLTSSSQLLLKNNPFSVTPFLLAELDPMLTKPWQFLTNWFINDVPTPFETANGMSFWDYGSSDSKLNNVFNEGMASDARLVTSVLVNQGKTVFDGLNSIVDVGGGNGTAAKIIAEAFPSIHCTVLDRPHVVADRPNSHNLKYVAGDMFEFVPPADAILLKWILHNWSDEECLKILENCKKAIKEKKGGKVIIIDIVMRENEKGDDEAIETQLFFDMLMMMLVTGKERNEREWAKLFNDVGFSGYKIIPILGLRSIIEVYP